MNIIVDIQNEKDEELLKEFLNKLKIPFKTIMEGDDITIKQSYLNSYNQEINNAVNDIENGNYLSQTEVENLLTERRNSLK